MTLVIGARFRDGVVLVADRKILGEEEYHGYKFIAHLCNELAFGCAGYAHKIEEFDRKIREIVNERLREIALQNHAYYRDRGYKFKGVQIKETKPEKLNPDNIESTTKKSIEGVEDSEDMPQGVYIYSAEKFLDDCKSLIKQVCTDSNNNISNDVELLLILFSYAPRLHHITWSGEEEEIKRFCAIGSGSHLVNYILKQHWKEDMTIEQILKLCFFCIYYIQDLKIDNSVGVEEEAIPDHLVIVNEEGIKYLPFKTKEIKQTIDDLKDKIKNLKNTIDSVSF